MAADEGSESTMRPVRESRLLQVVLAVTVLALAARLVFLGQRVLHWDEGRVAYWILRTAETGEWSYRPIVHGPFFPRVNAVVFEVLGASDFSARLVVAVVGGLLPLAAWLYRTHLRDAEVIALAFIFAANPVLLYYSRFMRNDVLLASFMLLALGFFARTHETRRPRYLYAGVAMLALAFTTKGNVLVYVVTWAGATALLLDHRLFRARDRGAEWTNVFKHRVSSAVRGVWRWKLPFTVAIAEFFVIIVVFYAPRPDFWQMFSDPAMMPDVVHAATVGTWEEFYGLWVEGGYQEDNVYLEYLSHYVDTLLFGAAPLLLLAAGGFLADRYSPDGPRDLVSFTFYWGFVTILGYPLVTDIKAPWGTVHSIAPLAIPAAVGVAIVYQWGVDAYRDHDRVGVALATALLVLVAGQVAVTAAQTSYVDPYSEDNKLVQYVQPDAEMGETLAVVQAVVQRNDGVDILIYGHDNSNGDPVFYVENESDNLRPPAASGWYDRLPLPWYFERYDANITSTKDEVTLEQTVNEERPPVVITHVDSDDDVAPHMDGYEGFERGMATHTKRVVIYIDQEQLQAVRNSG